MNSSHVYLLDAGRKCAYIFTMYHVSGLYQPRDQNIIVNCTMMPNWAIKWVTLWLIVLIYVWVWIVCWK